MRKVKYIIYVILIVLIVINGFSIYSKAMEQDISKIILGKEVEKERVIDSDIIIKKLTERMQVVGLEGEVTKEFNYLDNKWYGDKYLKMNLYGKFKIGFNVNEINREDVIVDDGNVIIIMPEIVLISLEVPYDKIEIEQADGMLRKDFTEDERQLLYKSAYDSIEKQILNDNTIIEKANEENENAIRSILMLIPEIKNVSFR